MRREERLAVRARRRTCSSARRRRRRAARRGDRERQRARHVARASGGAGTPARTTRVLAAAVDRAVVGEEGVRDPAEPRARVRVLDTRSARRSVPARQHERPAEVGAEQVVERRVRAAARRATASPARPTAATARRRAGARARSAAPASASSSSSAARDLGQRLGLGRQHRERLLLAVLAGAQPGDGLLVGGVAGEVVAAEPLDREDRPVAQQPPTASSSGIESRGPARRAAVGSAWKRRSAGSSYSRRQSAHSAKPAIVVFAPVVRDARGRS